MSKTILSIRSIFIILATLAFYGCSATAPKNIGEIKVDRELEPSISLPRSEKVAFFFPEKTYHDRLSTANAYGYFAVNVGAAIDKALDFVMPTFFSNAEKLDSDTSFHHLFVFEPEGEVSGNGMSFDYLAGLNMKVLDFNGNEIFKVESKKQIRSGVGGDQQALVNAFAAATKENVIAYLNKVGNSNLDHEPELTTLEGFDVKLALNLDEPVRGGTGYFINESGDLLTSTHIVNNCLDVEIRSGDEPQRVRVKQKSILLDVAVLDAETEQNAFAHFRDSDEKALILGEDVFTIGYPLANVLSGEPNLTVGNVSSLGALKGSKGFFQFTAPTQPGNSGSPVISKSGGTLGMVSSTLNMSRASNRTQNVNFAVHGELIKQYLSNNNVDFYELGTQQSREAAFEGSSHYTVQVTCYR